MLRQWNLFLAILAVSVGLAFLGNLLPSPKPVDAPVTEFSAARAMIDVRRIASEPHPTGSQANSELGQYLSGRLEEMGFEVTVLVAPLAPQGMARLEQWGGDASEPLKTHSLLGVLPGTDRDLAPILLMAHYDSVWASPGAADDGAGLASILESIRALNAGGQHKRDLLVLFSDGEELHLNGARAFFENDPLAKQIGAIVNLEARGAGGRTYMFQTNAGNGEIADFYASHVGNPSTSSLAVLVYRIMPNDTDLTPALEQRLMGYNLAFIGKASLYHSPLATPENLDQGTLQHMGDQTLALARALLNADTLPQESPDQTLFDLFGLFAVSYPAWLDWLFLVGGFSCFAFAARKSWSLKETTFGAARMLGLVLLGAILLEGVNILSQATGAQNYYDRLAAVPRLEWMAVLLCIAALLAFLPSNKPSPSRSLGIALPITLIAALIQYLAPSAAYFVVIPLFVAGATNLAMQHFDSRAVRMAAAFMAAIATGYLLSLGHLVLQGLVNMLALQAILPASIIALVLIPFWPGLERKFRWRGAALSATGGVAIALWVMLDPIAETVPPYAGSGGL